MSWLDDDDFDDCWDGCCGDPYCRLCGDGFTEDDDDEPEEDSERPRQPKP